MKVLKIVSINIFIILITIIFIELIFGYWFDEDNLGPYMREHRMKKVEYSLNYNNKKYNHTYKRNYYGFRGEEINLDEIKGVIIGGSTTDERYKPESQTITGYLNKKLAQEKKKIKFVNAGIEGQSTLGHIYNFENWFPKLKNFKPKYIIFYVGINDSLSSVEKLKTTNLSDGHMINPDSKERIFDNIKSRSIFYDLLRKTKHKYYNSKKTRIIYDFNHSSERFYKKRKFKFLNYNDALKIFDINNLIEENQERVDYYLNNIDDLFERSISLGSIPIFVNQLQHDGHYNEKLFSLNYSLINHCKIKNYKCIDLASKLQGRKNYWWDGTHTTAEGSKVIVDLIFPEIKNIIN